MSYGDIRRGYLLRTSALKRHPWQWRNFDR